MNGRRVHNMAPHELRPGDYGRWAKDSDNWYCCCPDGQLGNLSKHSVVEHDDGTITVSPSILVTGHRSSTPTQWHGYLERGVWREC